MKFNINPGEFRNVIEIYKYKGEEKNSEGILINTFVFYFKAKAKVVNVRGDEFIKWQGINEKIEKTFYIRASKNFKITNKDKITYNAVDYNIIYVNNIEEKGRYIEIKAERVE